MSHRTRKLDKSIIDQSAYLDIDDQNNFITSLSNENLATYKKYLSYLQIIFILQLTVLIVYQARIPLCCVLMSLISASFKYTILDTKWANWLLQNIDYLNAVLCLQTLWQFRSTDWWRSLYMLLPSINLVTLVMFRWWNRKMENDVNGLEKLVYKYKSV